jgi:hypothetical protein
VLTPSLVSSSSTSLAIVVLPEPGRPVSHKQKFIIFETVETVEIVEVVEVVETVETVETVEIVEIGAPFFTEPGTCRARPRAPSYNR